MKKYFMIFLITLALCASSAHAQASLEVKVANAQHFKIVGAAVAVEAGGATIKKITGDDGTVLFTGLAQNQAYTVVASHPAYNFSSLSGTLSGNTLVVAEGTGGSQTLSGKIVDGELQPIGDAIVRLNDIKRIDVDDTTGEFSIELPYGSPYKLSVSHEDRVFFHDSVTGVLNGNAERVFVGYNK